MRHVGPVPVSTDVGDLGPELRRLFEDLSRRPDRGEPASGECLPLLDVLETEQAVELVLDVPGVTADAVRVLVKGPVVIIAGEKVRPAQPATPASFHLIERDFGRFVRAVRVSVAFDGRQVRAQLRQGELRVLLPKTEDRRGREIAVPVETVPA